VALLKAENVMAVITLLLLLFTHIMQTFFMIWLMDVKKISSNWTRLGTQRNATQRADHSTDADADDDDDGACIAGRFCQMAMIVYNLYAFLLYAFYANNAYESSSAAGTSPASSFAFHALHALTAHYTTRRAIQARW
jgi:maltoporin